jgi:nucleotide-binding universal stress UspA family protein
MAATPRCVLVATDLEPTTDSAIVLAAYLAARFAADLHLLHVQVVVGETLEEEQARRATEALLHEGRARAADALVVMWGEAPAVPTHEHVVRGLSAAESIVEACGSLGCDLVAVGTHGRRGLRHLLVGSVAEELVRTSPVPVLAVRPGTFGAPHQVRRLLVPHDFSTHSLEALRLAASWAKALGASVTLLHVVEPVVFPQLYAVDPLPEETFERARERSTAELETVIAEVFAEVPAEAVVVSGTAAETILVEAEAREADLVVMGSRGLSGLEHLLLGSVAEKVLRRSPVPLLTVRSA